MHLRIPAFIAAVALLLASVAAAGTEKPDSTPQDKIYNEIRAKQELGRVIASPDGSFFVYEWTRPYDWARDFGTLPGSVAGHMQAWLYRVNTDESPANSDYIFFPDPGGSYWLGSLSPDAKKVSFYELDEDNTVKAGVYDMATSQLTWLSIAPDAKRLSEPPVWTSNEDLIYPASGAAPYVRASVLTGKAAACGDCKESFEKEQKRANPGALGESAATALGPDTNLLTRSRTGDLTVYAKDTPDVLSLIVKKGAEAPQTVFENKRH